MHSGLGEGLQAEGAALSYAIRCGPFPRCDAHDKRKNLDLYCACCHRWSPPCHGLRLYQDHGAAQANGGPQGAGDFMLCPCASTAPHHTGVQVYKRCVLPKKGASLADLGASPYLLGLRRPQRSPWLPCAVCVQHPVSSPGGACIARLHRRTPCAHLSTCVQLGDLSATQATVHLPCRCCRCLHEAGTEQAQPCTGLGRRGTRWQVVCDFTLLAVMP